MYASTRVTIRYLLKIATLAQLIPLSSFSWIVDFNNPVVHTQYGSIRGKIDERKTKFNRRPICTFLSIPYARPPIGSNRFLPPVEPDAWQNLDAFSRRVMCPQVEQRFRMYVSSSDPIIESEDCLYLNVFVPVDRATPVINYPVIVYIHGGEFRHGSKDHYSPEYLLDHGIILVTINYRLGVLGFLSTDDMAAPGNLGLYDQIAALRWVKRNIQTFGGNNDDMTLMGHDAGAISAGLLLVAPHETQGLINKAIIIGGSAFSPAAFHWNPRRQSREFARELRCMDERSDKLVRCLRLKDWRLLVAASRLSHNFESNTFRYWFRPVIDRNSTYSLLRDYPAQLYASGQFLRVPLMGGLSAHEGSLEFFINWHQLRPLSSLERIRFLIRPYLYEFSRSEIVATTLDYNYVKRYNSTGYALAGGSHFHHNGQQVNALNTPLVLANHLTPSGQFWHEQNIGLERNEYDVYISPNDQRSKTIARQIDAIGDFLFVAPVIRQLELHSRSVSQTYMFLFDYKGTRSFGHIQLNPYGRSLNIDGEAQTNGWLPSTPTSTGPIISSETSNFGVTHNDDLFYLLPNDFAPAQISDAARPDGPSSGSFFHQLIQVTGAGQQLASSSSSSTDSQASNDDNAVRNYVTYLAAFASRISEQQSSNNLANWLPFRITDRNYIRFSEQLPTLYKNFHQIDVAFVNELVEPIEELVNTPLPLFPYEELRDFKVSTAALGLMLLLIVLTLLLLLCLLACKRRRRRQRLRTNQEKTTTTTKEMRQIISGAQPTTKNQLSSPAAAAAVQANPPNDTKNSATHWRALQQQAKRQWPAPWQWRNNNNPRRPASADGGNNLRPISNGIRLLHSPSGEPNLSTDREGSLGQKLREATSELAERNERTIAELEGRLSRLSQRFGD